jgi:penicillin amidase
MNLPRLLLRLALGRRLPVPGGELTVAGLERPVTIRRDGWGVPHVEAETDADALFGLGFAQGQDRGFQLELLVRLGRGTLAELVGPDGLPADRMSRRIGFRRAADRQLPALDADVRAAVTAFAAGVNAGRTVGLTGRPHEMAVLGGGEMTAWEPADALAFVKVQSFLLPSNWDVELARLKLLRSDGPDAVLALDPVPTEWLPTIVPPQTLGSASRLNGGDAIDLLRADLARFAEFAPRGGGSNNWAVAGGRSATGKPLLACDPHLGPAVPNPWYLAHLRTPGWAVAGAAFAGGPVFPIGHNGFACWGVTAGLTDTTDLFLETLGPDGRSVREADGAFAPCEVIRETIPVKGSDPVIEEIVVTPRGPIISPLVAGLTEAVSLRAVWLLPLPLRGFFDAPRAGSFEAFRRPFAAWPVLPLNVVYADAGGAVGYQLIGQLPRRTAGFGTLPLPADAPGVGWEPELVPFDAMPWAENPEGGFVATANNPPGERPGSSRPDFLGIDFMDGYRASVIGDELAKRSDWTVPLFQQLQTNVRSRPWEEIREAILALSPTDPDAVVGLGLLREWDGHAEADSPAAAMFELFCAEMAVRLAKAKAPNGWAEALGGAGTGPLDHSLFADRRVGHLVRLVRGRPDGWFARGWDAELADAVAAAVRRLRAEAGPSPAYWGWGHLRHLRLRHPVLGKVRGVSRAFNLGPVPVGGDANTIFQAGSRPLAPTADTHNFPNLRAAFDTANWANCRFALAGGQSGNPCSPHYDDQWELWQRGDGIPIPWTADEVLRAATTAVRLTPGA